MRIRVGLPDDRDFEGRLEVLDANDAVVLGPVPAAGRAHDEAAATHGNPSRSPLMPYGDTPLGTFAVRGVIESSSQTGIDADLHGSHGVVLLEPLSGQAALADAHGRFRLFIQGGGNEDGALRATAGAVRLRDRDQAQLVALLRRTSGPVLCEVASVAKRGARVSLATPPLDHDPPPLPGRSYLSTPRPAKSQSRAISSFARVPAGYESRTFVVVPERSGSGGTGYGGGGDEGGGSGPGGESGGGAGTGDTGPFPTGGVDVSPVPGGDLNPPPDDTGITIAQSGGSDLLTTAAPTGLSDPYSATENGWIVGQQPADPATNLPATGNPLQPYVGNDATSFTGAPPDSEKPNSYTGGPSVDPATNTAVAVEPDVRPNPDPALASEAQQRLQGYIDLANEIDASRAGSGAQQPTDLGTPAPANTTPGPSGSAPQRDTIDDPDAAIQEMVTRFAKNDADLAAQQSSDVGTLSRNPVADSSAATTPSVGQSPDPIPPDAYGSTAPTPISPSWSRGGQPDQEPTVARPLGAGSQANQGRGVPGQPGFEATSPPGGAFLKDLNTGPQPSASTDAAERLLPWLANEFSNAGAVRALDALNKANLGKLVTGLLENESTLDNIQRISKFASESRQAIRAADQAAGGFLNRTVSPLLDRNSGKTFSDFVSKALGGEKGEQALEEAYRTVAANSSVGRESANTLGMGSRALGGGLGVLGLGLSGYSLQDDLSKGKWFDSFVDSTSFVSSGLAVGGAAIGSVALTEGGLVLGSFGVGALIGTGLDKGLEWGSKEAFGVDLSPSALISYSLTTIDQLLTPLWADPTKPAYTQSLGWMLADWFGL